MYLVMFVENKTEAETLKGTQGAQLIGLKTSDIALRLLLKFLRFHTSGLWIVQPWRRRILWNLNFCPGPGSQLMNLTKRQVTIMNIATIKLQYKVIMTMLSKSTRSWKWNVLLICSITNGQPSESINRVRFVPNGMVSVSFEPIPSAELGHYTELLFNKKTSSYP